MQHSRALTLSARTHPKAQLATSSKEGRTLALQRGSSCSVIFMDHGRITLSSMKGLPKLLLLESKKFKRLPSIWNMRSVLVQQYP